MALQKRSNDNRCCAFFVHIVNYIYNFKIDNKNMTSYNHKYREPNHK